MYGFSIDDIAVESREFWRLENAYDDFDTKKTNGDVLPCANYPMQVEKGQVFLVRYTKIDGTTVDLYYRSSGARYNGKDTTTGFVP